MRESAAVDWALKLEFKSRFGHPAEFGDSDNASTDQSDDTDPRMPLVLRLRESTHHVGEIFGGYGRVSKIPTSGTIPTNSPLPVATLRPDPPDSIALIYYRHYHEHLFTTTEA